MKYLKSYKIFEDINWDRVGNITELVGKTINKIFTDKLNFITVVCDNKFYNMEGDDDLAHIEIDDINGDLNDLINSPLLIAEENTNRDLPSKENIDYDDDSYTWTFYKLATIKGYVDIKWYGCSNGYYSEEIIFSEIALHNLANPYYPIWELFKDESKLELFYDYDIIQDGEVNLDRLNDFLLEIGKSKVIGIEYEDIKIKIIK